MINNAFFYINIIKSNMIIPGHSARRASSLKLISFLSYLIISLSISYGSGNALKR